MSNKDYDFIFCFNSLQVDYQLDIWLVSWLLIHLVSIPYRQTINEDLTRRAAERGISFNSLQVDYQLSNIHCTHSIWRQFQFLIGRLSTDLIRLLPLQYRLVSIPYRQTINHLWTCSQESLVEVFQFLIGRLSTFRLPPAESTCRRVSIPYRQTINEPQKNQLQYQKFQSFNSLQVDYQPKKNNTRIPEKPQFQFLIGRLSTK